MKVKYIGEIAMMSQGITYENGRMYEVKDEVGDKLLKTFGDRFEELVAPKPKPAPKAKPTKIEDEK